MKALVIGATGQDGYFLTRQLVESGAAVHAIARRPRVIPGVTVHPGDLLDQPSLETALRAVRPDVVYNLAAVTSPGGAWGTVPPPLLADVTAVGVVRLLAAVDRASPESRVVHASSSAIHDPHRYGLYGISKRFAHDAVVGYRETLHTANAVLYSHTSPRQDPRFLAPTIARVLAARAAGGPKLVLTDVTARRDWGCAPDFCRALQAITEPGDYTVASGERHTVREFVDVALSELGLTWADAVHFQPGHPVPDEPPADLSTAPPGWTHRTPFDHMVRWMVKAACRSQS